MSDKPGVMIYFDILPAIRHMSNADKGILFEAMLEYGQTGMEMELPKRLHVLWPLIQMRLDSDTLRYEKTVITKKYAAYVRWSKKQNINPISFVDWMMQEGYERYIRQEDYSA